MDIPVFMLVNIAVGSVLLILLARYVWNMWFSTAHDPVAWKEAKTNGILAPGLQSVARFYPDKVRFFSWWLQVERLKKEEVPGDFAEVGVYKGNSARAIHLMDPARNFHLFDTFEGFPAEDLEPEKGDAATYSPRHFADTSPQAVITKTGSENIILHKGRFQKTASEAAQITFALVNLDADLYLPTKAALEFFYPRLSPGGVIFIHDYNARWEGIRQAVDEFAAQNRETFVLLPDCDSTVLLVKSKK